jgi:tetratricopeptide (TPR) repeat protein
VCQIGDRAGEGATLDNIGGIYRSLGQYQEALEYHQQALDIQREVGDRAGEGATLNSIGVVYDSLGQYQEALEYYQQALDIRREVGDRAGEGTTLNNIGGIYDVLGQYQDALKTCQQALDIRREVGDRAGEGTTLNNTGLIYHTLGQYQEALEYYQQALDIRREIGDRTGEGATLNNIGGIYESLGQYQEALKHYQQALDISREIGDREVEGATLNNIGEVYRSLGQYQEALETYQQALDIRREVGDRAGEGATLNNVGMVYHSLARYQEALKYHQQALDIAHQIGYRAGEGTTLNNIGGIYHSLGQYQEALKTFQQALDISREIRDRAGEGTTLSNIGGIYHNLGQYQEALETYQQALDIRREVGDRDGEAVTLGNIGHLHEQQGQFEEALDFYQQAIDVHEAIRASATVEEFKTALSGQAVNAYRHAILLLMKLSRPAEAFHIAERARARTFLDQLANAHISPTGGGDPALIQQEEDLRGHVQALDRQLRDEWAKPKDQRNDQVIQSLTTQLETKRAEYAQLLQTFKLNNPEYASLVTVDPLTLTDVQEILTNITLIEYFVTAEQTVAFVVTRENFHAVQITVTRESLVENVEDFYLFPSLKGVPTSMKSLYQQLIAPLKPYIKTDLVCIVPHGVLHYLPFGALHDGKHYLVEEYTLFYAPSASVLPFAFEKRKSSVAPPLVLGDPDGSLPHSREEAQAIAQLHDMPAHVGADALERLLWEEGQDAGIIHLSTHGVYNDRSPLFSRVLLAPDDTEDGYLEVYEIYNRGLNLAKADLVVLSACQTNVGELSHGDEIVGLSRALIYAGTPSVVASLWSVSDESTRVLMESFYTHMQEGMSKAEALQAAQMEMIASEEYAHPYHWAAFEVTGDDGGSEITEQARQVIERVATPAPTATSTAEKPGGGICPAVALPLVLVSIVILRRRL